MKTEPPIYFFGNEEHTSSAPKFYNPKDFDWIPVIEANWLTIKEEMLKELTPDDIVISNYNPNLVKAARVWRNICFINYLWKKKEVICKYPKTWALLQQIPNLSYAALNMLEPQSEIYPHIGDTNITARCHLGLQIPASLPLCGLKVNGQQIAWQEGKIFAFSDAHLHNAWNKTDKHRFVFVIDVILPQYAAKKEKFCSNILAVLTLKAISYKIPLLSLMPMFIASPFKKITALLWRGYIRWQ